MHFQFRNICQIVLQGGLGVLHSFQQCVRVPIVTTLGWQPFYLCFSNRTNGTHFLICSLLVVNEVKYSFVCLLAICFPFSMKMHLLKQRPLCCTTQVALQEEAPNPLAAAQAAAERTQL